MTLPTGTVTFLRSDIEGSMALARALGARYDELNAEHAALVRAAVEAEAGHVVRTEGDAFFVVFTEAGPAARAAIAIQRAMATHPWPEDHAVRVRIGLHTGVATRAGDDYGGFEVNRAARIGAVGWGGQIVISDPTRALLAAEPAPEWTVTDLGRHRLKGIDEPEHLFGLVAPGLQGEFPALRSGLTAAARHLPERLDSFVGREAELADLSRLLADTRLLTLVGPGGSGKTTLAVELARRHADTYPDCAWFVDLQAVRDAARVREQVALGLGLLDGPAGTAADRLYGFLADRELLLIIDNFEQVIDAADVVSLILSTSPRSRVIATSRIPLRVAGEQEYPVAPLRTDAIDAEVDSDAARLFLDRARRVRPGLVVDDATRATIHAICALLDGLPLAIELAASRANALSVATIHQRLAQHLPLPGPAPRGTPERQRTIESTTAWSCDLLDEPVRRLLGRLSVFIGSFGYEQAEEVCGPAAELGVDVLEGIVLLTEHSLLQRADDDRGALRYRMLETVQVYAAENLVPAGEREMLRARHAAAYRRLAEETFDDLPIFIDPGSVELAEPDARNLRAACEHIIAVGEVEAALTTTARLWRLWQRVGQLGLGRELVARALAMPGADAPSLARVRALSAFGGLSYWSADMAAAHARYLDQAELAERLGDHLGAGDAYLNLAFTYGLTLDSIKARDACERAMTAFVAAGDERRQTITLVARILVYRLAAEDADEVASDDEIEGWVRRVAASEDPQVQKAVHGMRAAIFERQGDRVHAAQETLWGIRDQLSEGELPSAVTNLLVEFSYLVELGRLDLAAVVHAAVEEATSRYGIRPPGSAALFSGTDDPVATLEHGLEPARLAELRQRGRHIPLEVLLDEIEEALRQVGADRMRSP